MKSPRAKEKTPGVDKKLKRGYLIDIRTPKKFDNKAVVRKEINLVQ